MKTTSKKLEPIPMHQEGASARVHRMRIQIPKLLVAIRDADPNVIDFANVCVDLDEALDALKDALQELKP